MTTVDIAESIKYGFKLFAYLLAVVVVGGGGMALGGALLEPIVLDGSVTDELTSPELLGGAVLGALGLIVFVTGIFGLVYKLLADAVDRGTPDTPLSSVEESDSTVGQEASQHQSTEPVGPSPGEQSARSFGPSSTVPGAPEVSDRATVSAETQSAEQQSATDEQIAEETSAVADTSATGDDTGQPAATTSTDEDGGVGEVRGPEERTAEEIAFGDTKQAGPAHQPPADDEGETTADQATTDAPAEDGEESVSVADTTDKGDTPAAETVTEEPETQPTNGTTSDRERVGSANAGDTEKGEGTPVETDDLTGESMDGPTTEPDDSGADELFSSDPGDTELADDPFASDEMDDTENSVDDETVVTDDDTSLSDDETDSSDTDPLA